jgi:hypothetical protein
MEGGGQSKYCKMESLCSQVLCALSEDGAVWGRATSVTKMINCLCEFLYVKRRRIKKIWNKAKNEEN